ncbi:MAG: nucleotidyltransferase domain-containing protein [Candidatus Aenigmatarchaeota archaeon]
MSEKETASLSETLVRRTALDLLKELIQHPDRELSIRALGKEAEISYVTARNLVSKLLQSGLLKEEKKSNGRFISLNTDSPYYGLIKEMVRMDTRPLVEVAESYAKEVSEKVEDVEAILLYGSVARGDPDLSSDIDILVLVKGETEKPESIAGKIADKYQRKNDVKISPLVENIEDYRADVREEDPFYQSVNSSKIVLYGDFEND